MRTTACFLILMVVACLVSPGQAVGEETAVGVKITGAEAPEGGLCIIGVGNAIDIDPSSDEQNMVEALRQFLAVYDAENNFKWAYHVEPQDGNYSASDIAVDSAGNVHVFGHFAGEVDFDPTEGIDNKTAAGTGQYKDFDCFLTKFGPDADYIGTVTWGAIGWDMAESIFITEDDEILVQGIAIGKLDLDPGDGEHIAGYTYTTEERGETVERDGSSV